jgi:hypothetical protein
MIPIVYLNLASAKIERFPARYLKKWNSRDYARITQSDRSVAFGIYSALPGCVKPLLYVIAIIEYLQEEYLANSEHC